MNAHDGGAASAAAGAAYPHQQHAAQHGVRIAFNDGTTDAFIEARSWRSAIDHDEILLYNAAGDVAAQLRYSAIRYVRQLRGARDE